MKLILQSLRNLVTLRWLTGRNAVIAVPALFLTAAFLIPFLIVLRISLSDMDTAGSPFGGLLSYVDGIVVLKVKVANYLFIAADELYLLTYLSSIKYAAITTAICLFIGYPFAYFMARARPSTRPILMMLVMLPFWTSFLLRVYAWKGILANHGLLNDLLIALGVVTEPVQMMNTSFSLVVGMVYAYLPFMILPLYANLVKMDLRFLEAAADLGATPLQAFWRITVPLSKSGIIAGAMLVFIPSVGEYVIPELLGGPETLMIGRVLWDEYFTNNDWAMASSVTVLVILLILVPMAIFNKYKTDQTRGRETMNGRTFLQRWFGRGWLSLGYLFLYLPIIVLIVFSFNSSRQDMVWTGFSLRWYQELMSDTEIISGFGLSLKIAFMSATSSVVLGTFAAFALVNYQRFKGRTLFSSMVSAPLVMPEVIIGLSLLLMLVSMQKVFGFPERGVATIWLGHTLLGMAYAAVVVQSRLQEMSKSLAEAAMDLGCRAHQVFFLVTLPNITQALASAWLLTFTLSLDDVVLSAFLSGPGSTTMPLVIFSRARLGLDPRVNAIAALTILVVTVAVIVYAVMLARSDRRRRRQLSAAYTLDQE